MPIDYNRQEVQDVIHLGKNNGAKTLLICMAIQQARQFLPLAAQAELTSTSYQMVGSEAAQAVLLPNLVSTGYMYFNPVSAGPLYSRFSES